MTFIHLHIFLEVTGACSTACNREDLRLNMGARWEPGALVFSALPLRDLDHSRILVLRAVGFVTQYVEGWICGLDWASASWINHEMKWMDNDGSKTLKDLVLYNSCTIAQLHWTPGPLEDEDLGPSLAASAVATSGHCLMRPSCSSVARACDGGSHWCFASTSKLQAVRFRLKWCGDMSWVTAKTRSTTLKFGMFGEVQTVDVFWLLIFWSKETASEHTLDPQFYGQSSRFLTNGRHLPQAAIGAWRWAKKHFSSARRRSSKAWTFHMFHGNVGIKPIIHGDTMGYAGTSWDMIEYVVLLYSTIRMQVCPEMGLGSPFSGRMGKLILSNGIK